MELVKPTVHLIGVTSVDAFAMQTYLEQTGNAEFMETFNAAVAGGVSPAEALCSMYAKLCYKSLTVGHNDNITRVRDIEDNVKGCFNTGHGSVFEHVTFNFVITDCSRVFTHELVRHRIGTAFSQTSGRYCRSDNLQVVLEDPIADAIDIGGHETLLECMSDWAREIETRYNTIVDSIVWSAMNFATKKKVTSYLRRLLPNGQGNEMGFSVNLRSLRHLVQMRTGRHAEWEIRLVFEQVYKLVKAKHPLVFHGAVEEEVGGILEVAGMKMQPYEDLRMFSIEELQKELERRES